MAKITVYVADTSVTTTRQGADYPPGTLLSDLGGTLRLWVGMSVLSIAELLQLLLDCIAAACIAGGRVRGAGRWQWRQRAWVEPVSGSNPGS